MANKASSKALRAARSSVEITHYAQEESGAPLDSPTLVPCNSPALTPAQSFACIPMQSSPPLSSVALSECFSPEISFNMSLVSDTISEDDEEFQLPASLADESFYAPPEVPQRSSIPASSRGLGLNITNISRKDGSAPFDGLGLLGLRPSHWRSGALHPTTEEEEYKLDEDDARRGARRVPRCCETCNGECEAEMLAFERAGRGSGGDGALSATFLAEALHTFADDPFHTHTLGSIPECGSWHEFDECAPDAASRSGSPAPPTEGPCGGGGYADAQGRSAAYQLPSRGGRNFTTATISSMMKRSVSARVDGFVGEPSSLSSSYVMHTRRARSATWPTSAGSSAAGVHSRERIPQRAWRI